MKFSSFVDSKSQSIFEDSQDFFQKNVATKALEWDRQKYFPKIIFNQLAELNLLGIRVSKEQGGLGLGWDHTSAFIEGLSYGFSGGVSMGVVAHTDLAMHLLSKSKSSYLHEKYLLPALCGDNILALAISETRAGSDVSAIECKALVEKDEVIISGEKTWITNGPIADTLLLAVRTGTHRYKGISLVAFPTNTPGFEVVKEIEKIGNLSSSTGSLRFRNCRISTDNIVGELNNGFYDIMKNFNNERLVMAIYVCCMMKRALEISLDYSSSRIVFDKPIIQNQIWRHRFADHWTNIEAAIALTKDAIPKNGEEPETRRVTMAKLFATQLSQSVLYDCTQVHGGVGYTWNAISMIARDLRLYTIGGGTSEVMKEILSKEITN